MQARDVMTRGAVTVGPDTSAKYAGEVMAERGFAALPVLDDDERVVGIVAEVDVLRDRLPADPRLHLRRDDGPPSPPPLLVRGVMTSAVRTVEATTDVADIAHVFLDEKLRSVPVLEEGRLVGIVSRRDLLRALVRPDEVIRHDLVQLIENYTGELGSWDVAVREGMATVRRTAGEPSGSADTERRELQTLARTVGGVVAVQVLDPAGAATAVAEPVHDATVPSTATAPPTRS